MQSPGEVVSQNTKGNDSEKRTNEEDNDNDNEEEIIFISTNIAMKYFKGHK